LFDALLDTQTRFSVSVSGYDDENERPDINLPTLPSEKLVQYPRLHNQLYQENASIMNWLRMVTQHVKSEPVNERDIVF